MTVLTEMPHAHRNLRRRRALQMRTAQIQQSGTLAIGEQAEVANADETGGQNMQQEATEKLIGLERHSSSLAAMGVVAPTEGDLAFGHGDEARVGDGDAMSITREIGEDLRGSSKRSLGIDDPFTVGSSAQ